MEILFGGSGRLGRTYQQLHPETLAPSSAEVDITDAARVRSYLREVNATRVLHAAAVVGLDEAERHPERAYRVNVEATHTIAAACRDLGARLIYLSSVAVFDGATGGYTERSIPRPAYYYGWLKLLGEAAVRMHENSLVVRTDFFVPGSFKYRDVHVDHFCSKLPVASLCRALAGLAASDYRGVLHVGGPRTSLYDLIRRHQDDVRPVRIQDSTMPDFPQDLSLDSSRFRNRFPHLLEE